ncbi:universal stress protein [Nocardioides aequoreus]|uniref:universal stress protein n=1 Tax=Nocardioides aequoreus TaxID=397278 RepID=UPI0004C3E6B2|nr:universal stress protein [Nocardioides aequoreus]
MSRISDIPLGSIVAAYDGSPSAREALGWAAVRARSERRPLAVVYATGSVTLMLPDVPVRTEDLVAAAREAGERQLAEAADQVGAKAPEVEVLGVVAVDDARTALLAASQVASLLVLGSRGRGPVATLLLGSVGTSVVRHAHCPVVVHRPRHHDASPRGVVAGADGSKLSRPVLERAFAEAERADRPLTVLHSSWDLMATWSEGYSDAAPPPRGVEQEHLDMAEAMAGLREEHPDVVADVVLAAGPPIPALAAISHEAELLVLGHEQRGLADRLLVGSVAVPVVERADCPVLVVPVSD